MPAPDLGAARPASGLTNSIANILGLLIPLAVFFLVTPYLVRKLGAAHFGVLTLFLAGVTLINSLDFGLGVGGVRALGGALQAERKETFLEVAREWWSAYLLLGFFVAGLLLLVGPYLVEMAGLGSAVGTNIRWHVVSALAVAVFCGFCIAACQLIPRAKEMFLGLMLLQALSGVLQWSGAALIVGLGFGIEWVLSWVALVAALSFFSQAWWAGRLARGLNWWPCQRFGTIFALRSYGLYVFGGQLASGATYHADKFFVSNLLGPAAVGYYGIATSLASKMLMLVATGAGFIFPRAVRLAALGDSVGLRVTYLQASRYVMLVSWPMLVVALLLGQPFLVLWLGDEVAAQIARPLFLLFLAYFVNSLSVVASHVFNGIGNARVGATFSVTGAVINLVGCVVFIPIFGLQGAAIASLLASLQVFAFLVVLHRRLGVVDWPFVGFWVRLVLVGAMQWVLVWSLPGLLTTWLGFFQLAAMAWGLFYLAWFGLNLADESEKAIFRRLLHGVLGQLRRYY